MKVRHVRVGSVLTLARRSVDIEPATQYHEIGLRSFGKGIFHKPPITGADLGTKRVFAIADGDLVVSNVFAWEGAVAVAGSNETGRVGSHRFMTWVVHSDEADAKFLYHYFTSEPGLRQLQSASPGSAGRNKTLGIKAFEGLTIPLPDIDEQCAIVSKLDSALDSVALEPGRLGSAVSIYDNLEYGLINRYMAASSVSLGELAEINPRPSRNLPDQVHFVPMADVDEVTGTIAGKQLVKRSDLGSGYKQFLVGDIIFARITPCMQNGKSAIFDGKQSTVGYGSTEFHVLRAKMPTLNLNIHRLLRTRWLRDLGKLQFTGKAGQQRVPADFLRTLVLPDLTTAVGSEMAAKLNAIDCDRRRLLRLIRHRTALQRAFPQAARNEVFSKLL